MIKINENIISIETRNTTLVFGVYDYDDPRTIFNQNKKEICQIYYGLTNKKPDRINFEYKKGHGSNDEYDLNKLIFTTNGSGNNCETSLLLKNSDGTNINRFFFKDAKIIKGGVDVLGPKTRNVSETLDIVLEDEVLNLELHIYYSVCKDSDVISVKRKLINHGQTCYINRLTSLECPIPSNDLRVYTFDGKWLYERSRHFVDIESGMYYVDSKSGSSSHKHNPFIEIYDKKNDDYYGFNLIYSGNHKEIVDVNNLFYSAVLTGINDFGFEYRLNNEESFTTPEAIMVVSSSLDDITSEMHNFVNNHIINPKFANKERPVLFNNWEGTGMNIDEPSLYDMALVAKEVGVEQFVMDDGWFKGRVNDHSSLGDWIIDKNKFPNGLRPFVNRIKELNMLFGIWVEPEMICYVSDLYKEHPEYACIIPNRDPIERRYQLMIDMANDEVVDYLFDKLSIVFEEARADYVKWDYNRFFTDSYSHSNLNGQDYGYKFIQNVYRLIDKLQERFPNILFESCSSGGGRFDLGMIYYMPQTWGSDDTNTYCRSFIASGTLAAYPQSTYGAHVSVDGCPLPDRKYYAHIEDRFNLNVAGAFGYEFDFRKRTKSDLECIKNQIVFYKEHRKLLQFGHYYNCFNCFDDNRYYSYSLVNDDRSEAILYISELEVDVPSRTWTIKGLDPKSTYVVKARNQANSKKINDYQTIMSGEELMNKGVDVGSIYKDTLYTDEYNGPVSRLFYIRKK